MNKTGGFGTIVAKGVEKDIRGAAQIWVSNFSICLTKKLPLLLVVLCGTSIANAICTLQAQTSGRGPDPHLRALASELPPDSKWCQLILQGMRGEAIHQIWMDDMRKEAIKVAAMTLEFSWSDKGKKRSDWNLIQQRYFSDYDRKQLIAADRISNDLEKEIGDAALSIAKQGIWFEPPRSGSGTGYITVTLADNEWLPVNLPNTLSSFDAGMTPLMKAAMLGNINTLEDLLSRGVDINATSNDGSTALMYSAMNDSPESLRRLIEAGAKVNFRGQDGGNALTEAIVTNQAENARILIDAGANPSTVDGLGRSALSLARERHLDEVVELLERLGAR
jgi:hypothetical protein